MIATSLVIAFSAGNPILGALIYSVVMTIDHAIEQGRNVKAGDLFGYFTQTFVMSAISMGATKVIGGYFDQLEKTGLREIRRALAHGTFNGAMRFAQGGKPASRQAGLSTGLCQVLFTATLQNAPADFA